MTSSRLAPSRLALAALAALAVMFAMPSRADADVTIGLFAPTAPFEGSGDRVTFVTAVADHLASVAGQKVTGKVYANAGAFAAAVKKGEIQFAIVDAPYAAANGLPYTIIAASSRDGSPAAAWHLIAKTSVASVRDLRGRAIALPSVGAKAQAFVTNVLLGGEVDASYFGGITEAVDARSAVTMITLGKVDAAFVPSGIDAPAGTKQIASLGSIGWPMFVAVGTPDAKLVTAFTARIKTFGGAAGFSGFTDPGGASYRALAGSFGKTAKKGPMAVPPPARLSAKDLLSSRTFPTQLTNVLELVEAPVAPQ